jgi:hypothetical protein
MSQSQETVLTSMVEEEMEGMTPGARVFSLGTQKHADAIVRAVEQEMSDAVGDRDEWLAARVGEKVTLVQTGENMFGASMIVTREGKLFDGSRGVAILPKGARKNGYGVDSSKLLAAFDGWVADQAKEHVAGIRSLFPELKPLTQERLLELPGEGKGGDLTLAVFGTHTLFGAADCLFLLNEYWPEDDILDRGVLLIRPSHGESESGSFYGRDLLSMPVGEVVGFKPLSFKEGLELTNLDHAEALERVFRR